MNKEKKGQDDKAEVGFKVINQDDDYRDQLIDRGDDAES